MIFRESTNKDKPTIILLHGGGLSSWSLQGVINQLESEFHIVTPIIDGHGEAADEDFTSIQDSAEKLMEYIDLEHKGRVFAIAGLSLGAQIVLELLSQREDIAEYAILESVLIYPIKGAGAITVPTYRLFYGLIKRRWFSKLQAKALALPEEMLENYYQDSIKMSKQSLVNIALSNANYKLKKTVKNTKSKLLIIVGEKETGIMGKSAMALNEMIENSELHIAVGMRHGEMSLANPEKYVELLKSFFAKQAQRLQY